MIISSSELLNLSSRRDRVISVVVPGLTLETSATALSTLLRPMPIWHSTNIVPGFSNWKRFRAIVLPVPGLHAMSIIFFLSFLARQQTSKIFFATEVLRKETEVFSVFACMFQRKSLIFGRTLPPVTRGIFRK